MTKRHFPKGIDERMRDNDGEFRKKRSYTLVSTLRDEYGEGFGAQLPPLWVNAREKSHPLLLT